jgi:hypothetical protein
MPSALPVVLPLPATQVAVMSPVNVGFAASKKLMTPMRAFSVNQT